MKNNENESNTSSLPEVVEKAIEILNAPADRENIDADRQKRLDALKAIDDSGVEYDEEEFKRRLGARIDDSPMPTPEKISQAMATYSGKTRPTNDLSKGTGLITQYSSPRDLREKE